MTRFVTALALAAALAAPSVAAAQAPSLKNPASLTEKAPATYKVLLDTSAGPVVIQVTRAWAPLGADRFYNLVKSGFYDNCRFFRVISNFMVQFGINGDPAVSSAWTAARIPRDPVKETNKRGMITFAMGGGPNGPDTRTTQVFINFRSNANLDALGFAPFGEVTSGMEVVDKLYAAYGSGPQDAFMEIQSKGNAFLQKEFPKLDYIKKASIEK
jgi:peptidyl-prolyl cis-trans isomerase A (cyclophilin A)